MKTEINIKKAIIASLLLLTWAMPTYLHFSHHLEEDYHSHTVSLLAEDHSDTHTAHHNKGDYAHTYELRCEMCDYQFSNFIYEFENYSETISTPIISKITQDAFTSLCYYSLQTNTQLRAPPVFS